MLANAASVADTPRLSWFKNGLFWRTFLLLGLYNKLVKQLGSDAVSA